MTDHLQNAEQERWNRWPKAFLPPEQQLNPRLAALCVKKRASRRDAASPLWMYSCRSRGLLGAHDFRCDADYVCDEDFVAVRVGLLQFVR